MDLRKSQGLYCFGCFSSVSFISQSHSSLCSYFIQDDDVNGKKRAAFRGHGLEGVELDLPSGYELCILKKRGKFIHFL